jgi:hypothetical protein
MILRDPRLECVLEPFGLQNAADIASNILCEVFGIRHDHDLRRRLMGEFPSRKANGKKHRLQVPGRKIDYEPPSGAVDKRRQFSGEIFQIPVITELCPVQLEIALLAKARKSLRNIELISFFMVGFPDL